MGGIDLDIELLKTFQKIAQTKNVNRASKELFISQSSVLTRIRTLEDELGISLFSRKGKGVELSEEGTRLLNYVQKTILLLNQGIQEAQTLSHTPVGLRLASVSSVATYILPEALQRFHDRLPDARVHVHTSNTAQIVEWVTNGKVEIGLIRGPFAQKGVDAYQLTTDPIVTIVYPSHPWVNKMWVTPEDFQDETVIAFDRKSSIWSQIMNWFRKYHVHPSVGMELDHIETTKQMVSHQFGIAFAPFMTVREEIEQGLLRTVPLKPPLNIFRDTILIRHRSQPLSSNARTFFELMTESFS